MTIEDTGTVEDNAIPIEGQSELEQAFVGTPDEQGTAGEQQSQQATGPGTDPQQAQQPAPVGEQPPTDWDGSQFSLKYREQNIIPKSKEELINLAQRGFGYSQAMGKLNRDRQDVQNKSQQYQQYDQLDKMLKSNPQLAQKILQAAAEYHSTGGPNQQQQLEGVQQAPGSVSPEYVQRLERVEQEFQRRSQVDEDSALDKTIKALQVAHPDHQWDVDNGSGTFENQLIQFAIDNKIRDLEHAYRAFTYDTVATNTKAETLRQQTQQRVENNRQGIVQGGGAPINPAPANTGYSPDQDYGDLAAKMAADMR